MAATEEAQEISEERHDHEVILTARDITVAFGAKVYLFYVPLLWLVPEVFRSRRELVVFLQGILLLAIPIGVLGAFQYQAPPDSWLNVYSNETRADGVAVISDGQGLRARITGTFSYIAGYTAFLGFVYGLVIPLLAFPPGRGFLAVNLAAAVLVVGNMFMTGSRAPVLFVALSTALLGWAVFRMPGAGGRRLATTLGVLAVGLGVAGTVFGEARESLLLRARSSDSLVERLGWSFRPFAALEEVGLTGFGAGVTHPARYAVQRVLRQPPPLKVPPGHDFEPMQVLVELGAAGFLAWYAVKLALLAGLWRTWRRLSARPLGLFAMSAFAFHLVHLYLSVVLNHTANLLYWFTAGFIVLLPRLEAVGNTALPGRDVPRGRGASRGGRRSARTRFTGNDRGAEAGAGEVGRLWSGAAAGTSFDGNESETGSTGLVPEEPGRASGFENRCREERRSDESKAASHGGF